MSSNINEVLVLTTNVEITAETPTYTIQAGARSIYFLNNSTTAITINITGSQALGGLLLEPVRIKQNVSFSFDDVGKTYPSIIVGGTEGARASIVANY
jgi:hypothetical protein